MAQHDFVAGIDPKISVLGGESLKDYTRYKRSVEASVLGCDTDEQKKALGPKLYKNLLALNNSISVLVEQEDQSPERTQVGAARPEEGSPDFSDLLSAFEPGPGQGNVHGSDFMGFVPEPVPGQSQTEGLLHGSVDYVPPCRQMPRGGLRHVGHYGMRHMFIEEEVCDADKDGPKPNREPQLEFNAGQQRKVWWVESEI